MINIGNIDPDLIERYRAGDLNMGNATVNTTGAANGGGGGTSAANSGANAGTVNEFINYYRDMARRGGAGANSGTNLPVVTDPEKTFADITRQEYLDYIANYRDFEEGLINQATTDTSLIDQARADRESASALTAGIAARNRSRYGAALTPVQRQQQQRRLQLGNTLGGIQAVSDAKIAQNEANTRLLSDLINIGQGVNRSSQSQLGQSAANKVQLDNAYRQAQAASRAQTMNTIGSLGSMAILAFAL